mmetsp:Transcript_3588/g.11127  ORF Transcript_3588/g.11127 Transcript_3588/m.11127 type:complete len:153 (-) Transcript_3588:48-506(-)
MPPWHAGHSLPKARANGDEILYRQEVYGRPKHESPPKVRQRLTSTARSGSAQILDHKMMSPRSKERMRIENKKKRQELAGTQWTFGSERDMVDWKTGLKRGTVLNSGASHRAAMRPGRRRRRLSPGAGRGVSRESPRRVRGRVATPPRPRRG